MDGKEFTHRVVLWRGKLYTFCITHNNTYNFEANLKWPLEKLQFLALECVRVVHFLLIFYFLAPGVVARLKRTHW